MNPYRVLGISREADKREIMRTAALALQSRRFSAREIALAQKRLLDAAARAEIDFLYFVDLDRPPAECRPGGPLRPTGEEARLQRLDIFDR